MKENVNYGNWVSTIYIILGLFFFIIPFLISLLLPWFIIRIILLIISVLFLIPFIYVISLYYHFSKNNGELQNKIRNIVIEKMNFKGKGKILDIGTGAGPLAINLAKKYHECKITGIDYWGKFWNYSMELCIKNARIEGVENQVEFKRSTASDLPFKDKEFDAIVSNYVFHEVRDEKNKRYIIKEAFRVLKKGGIFSLQDVFGIEKKFGDINSLIKEIKSWGINQIKYEKTTDIYKIPKIVRMEFKKSYIIYGIK
ncbi:MAG: class I SAM-dependent methyltransferase [Candidatus Lokiarchaeota archaeon]|nr:class I SAM-dependent methyltransferase [Candidatus Lokiarchaeota archaeon]